MTQPIFDTPLTKEQNSKLRNDFGTAFAAKLKAVREEKGLKQQELSDKAGLHLTYLSHLERGVYQPSLFVVWKLAKVLDVKIDEFID